MEYVYPAIFQKKDDGSYTVIYPDIPGCISEGTSLSNAMYRAQLALTQWISHLIDREQDIPQASVLEGISVGSGEFVNLIYIEVNDERAVKRTVRPTGWIDDNEFRGHINTIIEANLKGTLAIFIGAGISKTANGNLKNWSELIADLKNELNDKKEQDYLKIAQLYYLSAGEHKYYTKVKKYFPDIIEPSIIHNMIFDTNPQIIITTNWDTILENAVKNQGYLYDIICSDQDLVKSSLPRKLIKMHGDFNHHNFVFKEDDYINYSINFPLLENYIKGILTTHTVLFLGYSYNDIDIKHIVKWIQNHSYCRPPMYMTTFEENQSQRRYLENYGITTLFLQGESEDLDKQYSLYTRKLHFFINMLNRRNVFNKIISDEDIIKFIYNKLVVFIDLQGILFGQLTNILTNCEIVFREGEPALIFSKDLLRFDFDKELQSIYCKFLEIIKTRILSRDDIENIIIDEPAIISIFGFFYKTGIRRLILSSELAENEEYFDLAPYLQGANNVFFENSMNFSYKQQEPEDIIGKKMNEAFLFYQEEEYERALPVVEDIISNCRTMRRWALLFIAMFNKNIITRHLKYYQSNHKYNNLKEFDLKIEYTNLPKDIQAVVEPVYDFLKFNVVYRLFFDAARDLDQKEGHVKTIRAGGMVLGSDGGKNYCQQENLLCFVIKNRIMIENYREYRTIHKTILTIVFTEQDLADKIELNRLELYAAIKYLDSKELMQLFSVCFPQEGQIRKNFFVSKSDKNWLVREVFSNLSEQYKTSNLLNHNETVLLNVLIILSIVEFEETSTCFIVEKIIEIISRPGNSYDIFQKIDLFLGFQYNLFSTRIRNDSLIKIIDIVIRKIITRELNAFEYRSFTGNGLRNIFGYTREQHVSFEDEKSVRQLIVEISDYESREKMEIISSILLNIYNITTDNIKNIIREFTLSINNSLDDDSDLNNNAQTEKDLLELAEKRLQTGSKIIFELNLALVGIKKLESPVTETIEKYLDRFIGGKYSDGYLKYVCELIIYLYDRDKNIELANLYNKTKQITESLS
jgi:predicted RNase H-like HicB family nuclease